MKSLFRRRKSATLPTIVRIPRCSHKGCGRFFATLTDVIEHEAKDHHCKKCGWGTVTITGSNPLRLCEVCDAFDKVLEKDDWAHFTKFFSMR